MITFTDQLPSLEYRLLEGKNFFTAVSLVPTILPDTQQKSRE